MFEGQSPSKPDKHNIVTKLENILEIKNDFENLGDTNNVLVDSILCSTAISQALLRNVKEKESQLVNL